MIGIRLEMLLLHLGACVCLIGGVLWIQFRVTKKLKQQVVGWVALPMSVGGFAVAGLVAVLFGATVQGWLGAAMFGSVPGLVFGLAVSWFVWRFYRKEIEGEE